MSEALTSTQIGAIGELMVANALLVGSAGELSPFHPVADDDGVDLLVYKKSNGLALPLQVKARTVTLKRRGGDERGNTVHFEVRLDALRPWRPGVGVFVLLASGLTRIECSWVIPLSNLVALSGNHPAKCVIRPSRSELSADRYRQYRCVTENALCERIEAELAMQR